VGVRKVRDGRKVEFESSYGFRGSLITHGIRRVSHHVPGADGPRDDIAQVLAPGQIVPGELDLPPSATRVEAGSELHLEIRGRWFYARNPLTGQFPAYYERSARGRCTIQLGPDAGAWLAVPLQPEPPRRTTHISENHKIAETQR